MQIKAYAKINLALDILKKDPSGYHHLQTILQQIDLHDVLTIKKIPTPEILLTSTDPLLPLDSNNTVYKAVQVLQAYLKKSPSGLHIKIQKNIPVAAGLGGGSSDAAAVLIALNKLWNLKLKSPKLEHLGAEIGMDVPFFILGGTAYADHFGEKIHALPSVPKFYGLLLASGQKKSTAEAYRKIHSHPHGLEKIKTRQLLEAIKRKKVENLSKFIHNDFDQIYQKRTADLRQNLYQLGAQTITCCGSGPLLFAVFKNAKCQKKAYRHFNKTTTHVWKITNMSQN